MNKYLLCSLVALNLSHVAHAEIIVIRKEVTLTTQPKLVEQVKGEGDVSAEVVVNEVAQPPLQQSAVVPTQVSYTIPRQVNNYSQQSQVTKIPNQFRMKNPPTYMACFYNSSQKYSVPVDLLLAIAQTESSFQPKVKGTLGYGADHGLMQINDYWLPRLRKQFSISVQELYDPCTNIEVASWILAHNFVQHKNWTDAVGSYNAVTKWKQVVYIKKVKANLERLHAGQL